MEQVIEQFKKYLDDSADPAMLKENPNLLEEIHSRIFNKFVDDHQGQVPENAHQVLAEKYFTAYLNDDGKATFFPPDYFPK